VVDRDLLLGQTWLISLAKLLKRIRDGGKRLFILRLGRAAQLSSLKGLYGRIQLYATEFNEIQKRAGNPTVAAPHGPHFTSTY
jgi:hypothetical protein